MVQLPPRDAVPAAVGPSGERPRYRPPIGIPLEKQRRAGSFALAVFLHILVVVLLIMPFASENILQEITGGGGPGPAGGGGGGNRGTGGAKERLEFVQVAPAPRPTPPPPVVRPPEVKPIVPPPPPPPKPVEQPKQSSTEATSNAQQAQAAAPNPGTGGGTGNDGSAGTGPGSGGGVGSGVGTGRGSSTGPGTGGGPGRDYPPSPEVVILPPTSNLKNVEVIVQFDIDSTGKVLKFDFNSTRDNNFNKKFREILSQVKWRPATNAEGQPISSRYSMSFCLGTCDSSK